MAPGEFFNLFPSFVEGRMHLENCEQAPVFFSAFAILER
jgi:hypothetical protein